MRMKCVSYAFALVVIISFVLFSTAQSEVLGKVINKLYVDQWLNESPRFEETPEPGQITIIDLYRFWYAPCRFHLLNEMELQKEFGKNKIKIIGISDEPEWQIKRLCGFLPDDFEWYPGLSYGDSLYQQLYQNDKPPRLPLTLVLNDQKQIIWAGSPTNETPDIIRGIINGTWRLENSQLIAANKKILKSISDLLKPEFDASPDSLVNLAETVLALELPAYSNSQKNYIQAKIARKLVDKKDLNSAQIKKAIAYAKAGTNNGNSGYYLDHKVLSQAYHIDNNLSEAISAMEKAIAVIGTPEIKDELQKDLDNLREEYFQKEHKIYQSPVISEDVLSEPIPLSGIDDSLSKDQAIEDFEFLHKVISRGHAGYDDAAWRLCLQGTGWQERKDLYKNKIESQNKWAVDQLFDLMTEYMEPIDDEHMTLKLFDSTGQTRLKKVGFAVKYNPYFTGIRCALIENKFVVISNNDNRAIAPGSQVIYDIINEPYEAELSQPYLFETLPSEKGRREFLLGLFLSEEPDHPYPFTFVVNDNAIDTIALNIHRCRIKYNEDATGETWSVKTTARDMLPLVSVRTAENEALDDAGFLKSAANLRDKQFAILDIRQNLGGSDEAMKDWCATIAPGEYRISAGNSMFHGGGGDVYSRWNPMSTKGTFDYKSPEGTNPNNEVFEGTLFVLVDRNVASSGETFGNLARQIPGAILLGENSRGCVTYGNCDKLQTLPHSGIKIRYGWVRFNWAGAFPILEGRGFFPQYWLDSDEPYQVIEDYIKMSQ